MQQSGAAEVNVMIKN